MIVNGKGIKWKIQEGNWKTEEWSGKKWEEVGSWEVYVKTLKYYINIVYFNLILQ